MTRLISPSEAADFNTCERLHYFKYRKKLRSKKRSATEWGSLFHIGLEPYYETMRDGGSKEQCFKAAEKALTDEVAKDIDNQKFAIEALIRMKMYSDHYYDEDSSSWEILEIEKTFKLPEHHFGFTPDLIVRELKGQHAGQLLLVDFKTGRDFWSDRQFEINAQLPRYVWGLQKFPEYSSLRRFMVSQIRTRDLKVPLPRDLFRRNKYTPTKTKLANQRTYHQSTSHRIFKFDNMSDYEHRIAALPSYSYSTCTYCKFSTICDMVTEARDTAMIEQIEFEVSDYGNQYL